MKVKIIIFGINEGVIVDENFEYSLGWIEFKFKDNTLKLFSDSYCMVFITIESLILIIKRLKNRESEKEEWLAEDNGYTFILTYKKRKIVFERKDSRFSVKYKKLKKSIDNSVTKIYNKLVKSNPEIRNLNIGLFKKYK